MGLVDGHRALVTGGGSGIGRATCLRLAAEGASVAVLDRDGGAAAEVAGLVDGIALSADVTDPEALADAVGRLDGLSILFANAGIGTMAGIAEMSGTEWSRVIGVNLTGVFNTVQACLPMLLASGDARVVCTASISGVRPAEGESAYAAAKAGVAAFTASLALEHGPVLRANAVSPGMIATALTSPLLDNFPDVTERMIAKTPAGRVGQPEDVADTVVFLCSDLARFVTGHNLVVDGGMILHGSGVDGLYRQFRS